VTGAGPAAGAVPGSRAHPVPHPCRLLTALIASALLSLSGMGASAADASLEVIAASLTLERTQITVSGISSGAYMAQQFHVAHSSHVAGAGLVAGGPYACASGSYPPYTWMDVTGLYAATSRCSNTNPWWFYGGPPDLEVSLEATRREADRGGVDDPAGMREDRVWLLSGGEDDTVPRSVVDVLAQYYLSYMPSDQLRYEKLDGAGHAMITEDFGNACGVSRAPFVSDCDFDAAGALLAHLLGPLAPRARAADPDALLAFSQEPFFDQDDPRASLDRRGHVYVPRVCRTGTTCRVHVAFHGCQQYEALVGDAFYARAGYNRWAESNAIVVLYPQTTSWSGSWLPGAGNPKGCWDWWGYSGSRFLARDGVQMAAVAAMVNALLGEAVLQVRAASVR